MQREARPSPVTTTHIAGAPAPPADPYDADVVILALDRPDETIAAIYSALTQTNVTRHVLVIDQGSHPDHLARLADVVAGRRDATLVSLGRNRGVAGGRNVGSALGHGRIIAGIGLFWMAVGTAVMKKMVTFDF